VTNEEPKSSFVAQPDVPERRGRPPSWAEHRAVEALARQKPEALAALADRLYSIGSRNGLAAVGITTAQPLLDARTAINQRVADGHHADMVFTFSRPEKATTPSRLVPDAASIVVGAWPYHFQLPTDLSNVRNGHSEFDYLGEVARYQWVDHYAALRSALRHLAVELKSNGWRARVLADDNALVDRAAAHRAGIGWFGKNANLLLPGHGSWFVLGAVVTNAPLPAAPEPVADGCGSCTRCIPACPTDAIVAPGVIDGRRCLAWLVQSAADIPEQFRTAMGARIYGCDDCQEACPENKVVIRRKGEVPPPPGTVARVDLVTMVTAPDDVLLERFGRWWLPNRNPDILRRNAVVALGNVGDPSDPELWLLLNDCAVENGYSAMVSRHAHWALRQLDARSGHGAK
jgi:epoxyqueuosine reductase